MDDFEARVRAVVEKIDAEKAAAEAAKTAEQLDVAKVQAASFLALAARASEYRA